MRVIVVILAVLCAVGWLFCHWQPGDTSGDGGAFWRHTAAGWQRIAASQAPSVVEPIKAVWSASPHPVLVALFVAMFSLLVLVAFSPDVPQPKQRQAIPPDRPLSELSLRSREWVERHLR